MKLLPCVKRSKFMLTIFKFDFSHALMFLRVNVPASFLHVYHLCPFLIKGTLSSKFFSFFRFSSKSALFYLCKCTQNWEKKFDTDRTLLSEIDTFTFVDVCLRDSLLTQIKRSFFYARHHCLYL